MTAQTSPASRQKLSPEHQDQFLSMLPQIRKYVSIQFRHRKPEARAELVAEAVGLAFLMFMQLVRRGRAELAYPTPLARFAVAQVRDGRRVGTSLNVRDVTSLHCHKRKGVNVRSLYRWDETRQLWKELVVEDRRSSPAEIAAIRVDFDEWLRTLSARDRKLALKLAEGETTSRVARMFKISAARVSQLRRELHEKWMEFHGELAAEPQVSAAVA
jgi:hypothetical protein